MEKQHCTDQDLINGVRTGCPASFCEITKRYGNSMYSYILRIVKNEDDAKDILQEAYIRIYNHLAGHKPVTIAESGTIQAWVQRIIANLCIDHFRKQKCKPVMVSVDVYPDTDNVFNLADYKNTGAGMDVIDAMYQAMTYLTDAERKTIVMHYFQGMLFREIAESCNISINTVLGRTRRAKEKILFHMRLLLPGKSFPKKKATA